MGWWDYQELQFVYSIKIAFCHDHKIVITYILQNHGILLTISKHQNLILSGKAIRFRNYILITNLQQNNFFQFKAFTIHKSNNAPFTISNVVMIVS